MRLAWPRPCKRPAGLNNEAMMIEGLHALLADSGQPGVAELRGALEELLGGRSAAGCLIEQHKLKSRASRVFRIRVATNDTIRSLVIKRLEPAIAWRNQLAITRWRSEEHTSELQSRFGISYA